MYGNTPSISIESKYGEGKKHDSLDNLFIGDYYYNENIVIVNGLKFNHISILFCISIVFLLIGIIKFNSRDLNN